MATRIWLVGAIPKLLNEEGIDRETLATFLEELMRGLVQHGAHLVHGSHPTVVPLMHRAELPLGSATLFLSVPHVRAVGGTVEAFEARNAFARVVPFESSEDDPEQAKAHVLEVLRHTAASQVDAVVSFGGNIHVGPDGETWSGVEREEELAEKAGLPVFRLASVPGWASTATPQDGRNGLGRAERNELALTVDPVAAVDLIVRGLVRYTIQRSKEADAALRSRSSDSGPMEILVGGAPGSRVPSDLPEYPEATFEVVQTFLVDAEGPLRGQPINPTPLGATLHTDEATGTRDVLELHWAIEGTHRTWVQWAAPDQLGELTGARWNADGRLVVPPRRVVASPDRSLASMVLRAVRHLRTRLVQAVVGVAAGTLRDRAVLALARKEEARHGVEPGLYHLPDRPDDKPTRRFAKRGGKGRRYVLFVHGTASSSRKAFRGLAAPRFGAYLAQLRRGVDDVLTFEHPTLTVSPVANALDLARALPDGAVLRLVTHSRGGLVGELLCWQPPATDGEVRALAQGLERGQRNQLVSLARVLRTKAFRVERFARVACPIRGTTLASERAGPVPGPDVQPGADGIRGSPRAGLAPRGVRARGRPRERPHRPRRAAGPAGHDPRDLAAFPDREPAGPTGCLGAGGLRR